jgi:hypothetical protein
MIDWKFEGEQLDATVSATHTSRSSGELYK